MKVCGFVDANASDSIEVVGRHEDSYLVQELHPEFIFSDSIPDIASVKTRWLNFSSNFLLRERFDGLNLYKIKNGFYFPQSNIVVDQVGKIVKESVQKPAVLTKIMVNDADFARVRPSTWRDVDINSIPNFESGSSLNGCIVFSGSLVYNYYHWLIEAIPRITFWGDAPYVGLPIILPRQFKKKPPEFIIQSLEFFGVNQARLIFQDEICELTNSFFLSRVAYSNTTFSSIVLSFYSKYRGTTPCKKIYISRSMAKIRRVLNESELIGFLVERDFDVVNLELLSFEDQVKLFQCSNIVVSAHGAGLSNSVFMPPDARVVELIGSDFNAKMTSYSAICEMFDLRYTAIIGLSSQVAGVSGENFDFEVRVEDIQMALD